MWNPVIAKNIGLALLEAIIVLLITQIPIWLGLVVHIMGDADAALDFKTVGEILRNSFSPGDILSYVAGILGSSTAYAIVKIGAFKVRPVLMLALILLPVVLLFLAAPVYILDYRGGLENENFARSYIIMLLSASVVLWLFALYQSRAFFEVHLPGSKGAAKIMKDIEG